MESSKTEKRLRFRRNLGDMERTAEIDAGVSWLMNIKINRLGQLERIKRAHELLLQEKSGPEIIRTLKNEFYVSHATASASLTYASAIHRAVFFESLASNSRLHIAQKLEAAGELMEKKDIEGAVKIINSIFTQGGVKKNMRDINEDYRYKGVFGLVSTMSRAAEG